MNTLNRNPCIAFDGYRRVASGPLQDVALAVKRASATEIGPILIYDSSGSVLDLDIRGTDDEILARLEQRFPSEAAIPIPANDPSLAESRGRGRPKLGVVAREVTLLPRHWDWLSTQPGSASVALRKLVEEARRTSGDKDRRRATQEAAYRFMSAIAGNFPGFEEAARALFAYDRRGFGAAIAAWPEDVRDHVINLAFADLS